MMYVFRVLSTIVSIYTFLCFLRIILTWIPGAAYSKFTQVIAKITDPYLNLFKGIRWLVMGSFDFSPAVALCLLSVVSTMLANFSHGGRFTVGLLLAMLVEMAWSIVSSIIVFLLVIFVVRLIMLLINSNSFGSNPILEQLDRSISPLVYNIARTFAHGKRITYKSSLIISIVALLVVQVAGSVLFNYYLSPLLAGLPF